MENLVIDPITKEYMRYKSNNELESKIGLLYNQENVILTNSGLHSNYITLNVFIDKFKNINIIYGNELYHETINLINYYKNINIYKLNNNINEIIPKIFNKINILFIESCSNPNGYIFDFNLIYKLRENSLKLFVICDNTWLTSQIFNPFDYDVDIVTTSLSKFYSGGNAIGGVCIFKNINDYIDVNNYIKIMGIHVSPLQLNIINKEINNITNRINNCSKLTYQILEYMSKYNNIKIYHSSLVSHKSFYLGKKYFKNNLIPSIFTISFNINENILLEIINKLKIINIETSFGSKFSKIDNYINKNNNYSIIRLSIGYDDTFDRIRNGIDELMELIYIYTNDNIKN